MNSILGIDEVGRGVWAGPLVVGAVVLGDSIEGITDSKKLSKKRREALSAEILEKAHCGLGWVSAQEIDDIGLSCSLKLATRRAIEKITVPYDEIIIDGTINFLAETNKAHLVTTLAKADLLVPAVSAASIIAKVARDAYMTKKDAEFDGYDFGSHVGYGTQKHRQAITKKGVCALHRLSIKPLQKYASTSEGKSKKNDLETTKSIGDKAEFVVEKTLEADGHNILARNWRTRYCEIDIVSIFQGTVYFTEVKYRKNTEYGGGISALTSQKIQKMKRAAEFFLQANNFSDQTTAQLSGAIVEGDMFEVKDIILFD